MLLNCGWQGSLETDHEVSRLLMTMIVGWFNRYNHPCVRRIVLASYSFLHVAGTLSMRQAFVGCLEIPHCLSSEEGGFGCTSHVSDSLGCVFGDGGNSLVFILHVGNGLEFAFLVWLSLMMPGCSLC